MKKIAIIVDSSSGIRNGEFDNVFVLPLIINATNKKTKEIKTYHDQIDIDEAKTAELLNNPDIDLSSSQASMGEIIMQIEKIYDDYDEIYVVPIPLYLSGSINTWKVVAEDYQKIKIAANNTEIAAGIKWCVIDLLKMIKENKLNEQSFLKYFEDVKKKRMGMLFAYDLEHLVKGGRLTNFKSFILKLFRQKIMIIRDKDGLNFFKTSSSFKKGYDIFVKEFKKKFLDFDLNKVKRLTVIHSITYKSDPDVEECITYMKKSITSKCEFFTDVVPSIILPHTGCKIFYFNFEV